MALDYIQENNFFLTEESDTINKDILKQEFPWFLHPKPTTDKFVFMSHTLIKRNEARVNSNYFSFFFKIFERFINKHKLKCDVITRACLNLTFSDSRFTYSDPHVDYTKKHKVIIMYLNNCSGDTYIFNKQYKDKACYPVEKTKGFKVLKKIKPKQGKIIHFDGSYYHANSFCDPGKYRIVCVITYI
tara:strand:+ start:192 stop:752 length:561 start_codon:yes stop_codon:yes gene_type:complete